MPTLKFLNVKNIDNFVAFSTRIFTLHGEI